jgi:3-dehydroquinate synthase
MSRATIAVQTVPVALPGRAYDVLIGAGLISQTGSLIAARLGAKIKLGIVTDTHVGAAHLAKVVAALSGHVTLAGTITVPAGEATKCFRELAHLSEQLLELRLERGDVILALGGGVIGDLAGFAAAILRRGMRFVQVPTSLLAQVDSSVGGKTGINTAQGKNLVGAFHQPSLVIADTAVLATLPAREMRAGYAEVVKYGVLGDRAFFDWLDVNAAAMMAHNPAALVHAVRRSVEMKAEIVVRDETETGDRMLLNLGHTFGHALEAYTGYSQRLLHGEGVAIGTCLAFRLSEQLGHCPPQTAARVAGHIKAMGLPTRIADIPTSAPGDLPDATTLVRLMGQDKKVTRGQLTLILARGIGAAFVTRDVSAEQVERFLANELAPG